MIQKRHDYYGSLGENKLTTEPWINSFQLCFLMLWEWDWKSREGLLEEIAFDWEWKLVLNSIKDQSISDRWNGLCPLSQTGRICCKLLRKTFREERMMVEHKARAKDNFGSYQIYFKTNRKPLKYWTGFGGKMSGNTLWLWTAFLSVVWGMDGLKETQHEW